MSSPTNSPTNTLTTYPPTNNSIGDEPSIEDIQEINRQMELLQESYLDIKEMKEDIKGVKLMCCNILEMLISIQGVRKEAQD